MLNEERKHNFSNCFSSLCEEHGSIIYAKEIEIDEVSKLNWNFTDWSASVMDQDVSDKYLSKFCLLRIRRKSLLYLNWKFVPGTWGKDFSGAGMESKLELTWQWWPKRQGLRLFEVLSFLWDKAV